MFDSEVGKHYLCTQVQHVILSEGRCHLGVALGWRDEDFETSTSTSPNRSDGRSKESNCSGRSSTTPA